MDDRDQPGRLTRRMLLTGGLAAAGAFAADSFVRSSSAAVPAPLAPTPRPAAVSAASAVASVHLAATDGWVSMPANAPVNAPFWPDAAAPNPFNLYVFGFRNVTGMTTSQVQAQRNKAQISAPLLWFDQETDVRITLSNLGLAQRPDLVDGHTLHWHGFQNAIPLFDGVPELSISVPIGRDFTYFYRPHDPGTYMYHCHYEDVEHVQMGMTGVVFVRPQQNSGAFGRPAGKYAYNDGDGSTAYDREFATLLTEIWAEAHYRDAHIQATDWTDYKPSFWALNGRCYPDTLQPNGDPLTTTGRLQYQPNSSLVTCNSGERILLRLSNLGYQQHALTADGLTLTIVGKDATLLKGRDGSLHYEDTDTVDIGPGESRDVLFTAPAVTAMTTFLLYDRNYADLENGGGAGYGGQMTEIRVYPAGTLAAQTTPNY